MLPAVAGHVERRKACSLSTMRWAVRRPPVICIDKICCGYRCWQERYATPGSPTIKGTQNLDHFCLRSTSQVVHDPAMLSINKGDLKVIAHVNLSGCCLPGLTAIARAEDERGR